MKTKVLSIIFLLLAFNVSVPAQVLKKLEKKVEQKVNQRINRNTDRAIDKGLDKVEGSIKKKPNNTKQKEDSPKSTNSKESQTSPQQNPTSSNQVNSKFDFIPGDKVLFYDDFSIDAVGDFPAKWNTNTSGEIITFNQISGKWLRIPDNTISFPEYNQVLPLNFTIEFDLYYPAAGMRPPVTFGFSEVKNPHKAPINQKPLFFFMIPASIKQAIGYSESTYSGREIFKEWNVDKMVGKPIRVSIAVNGTRIRLYMNDEKVIDLPKGIEKSTVRNNFHFRASPLLPRPSDAFYISNLRIAESGKDARSSLLKEGTYTTTGIYFNTGSSQILSHSHAVLKDIAAAFQEDANLKVKIIGHTDNVGNANANQKLSEDRANAVKNYLNKQFGIALDRMETAGLGDTKPVTPNQSAEQRAQNRRVEFQKIK